jgi:tetratricopeptide (TPR) repeat protein
MAGRNNHRKSQLVEKVKEHRWALAILAASLAIRVGFVLSMRGHALFEPLLPGYDMTVFHEWAKRIAGGELTHGRAFYQAPLYPYLLGALYTITGPNVLIAKLAQAMVGTLSVGLVYLLGYRLFDRKVALVASSLTALTPIFPFYETFLLRAALVSFLNLALLLTFAYFNPGRPLAWAVASGAVLGIAALGRANILVMLPVGIIWIWRLLEGKTMLIRFRAAVVFVLFTFVVISPASLHNILIGKQWALVSTNLKENWRIGNSYDSTGGFSYPQKKRLPVLSGAFWRLQAKKLGKLVSDYEEPNNLNFYHLGRDNFLLRLLPFSWGYFLAFGLAGIVLTRGRRRQLFPLYSYLLLYGASLVAFFVTSRFRVPLWPVLVLFSSAAFCWAFERLRKREYRSGAVALLIPSLLAFVLVASNDQLIQPLYFDNMVLIHKQRGDNRAVVKELTAKLRFYPNYPSTLWDLAYYLQKEGRKEEALEKLDNLLRAVGDQPQVLRSAGLLDLELGNRERGQIRLRRYLELSPQAGDRVEIERIISGPGSR